MPDYECIYDAAGDAVGFRRHRWVYDLDGNPVGMTKGNHVYKLSGKYIGELEDDMVVDRGLLTVPDTSAPGAPQNPGSVRNAKNRGARETEFKLVFDELLS